LNRKDNERAIRLVSEVRVQHASNIHRIALEAMEKVMGIVSDFEKEALALNQRMGGIETLAATILTEGKNLQVSLSKHERRVAVADARARVDMLLKGAEAQRAKSEEPTDATADPEAEAEPEGQDE